ncbi:DUF262 domain-containing protein [Cryobacterium sp. Hz9]|uniref:DUF262 domain-containing protein n=1 Tax=Cryobacterium sp. Hz9 TaxID=1259167 RepID=UPI00106986D1|nr:DUF262 domain-containing protein [Cryobacterium sp. Hz9]TFB66182.1 DUF262 domain-containing protein [Cryobacterium sp. Hz9]
MSEEMLRRVDRVVSSHDVSWLLDLQKNEQLDLNPVYQRKSVWTPRDRRFFMDTVFRNYPSPAIFLHKTINDDTGKATYHVVDGKQRITTILNFVDNKFSLAADFGDENFNGKRWRDFSNSPTIKRLLWNYRITVEELDDTSTTDINDVFSRLNKNASKLTPQELRHARFDGWFIQFVEREVQDSIWRQFKISTTAKERRMADVQNLSELATVVIRRDVSGFSQYDLDEIYAEHDDPTAPEMEFESDEIVEEFGRVREILALLEARSNLVSIQAQPFMHFYTLWALITRSVMVEADLDTFSTRYTKFMTAMREFVIDDDTEAPAHASALDPFEALVADYKAASVGATTEGPKRKARLVALEAAMFA